jgi:hypothetical protein
MRLLVVVVVVVGAQKRAFLRQLTECIISWSLSLPEQLHVGELSLDGPEDVLPGADLGLAEEEVGKDVVVLSAVQDGVAVLQEDENWEQVSLK